MTLKSSQLASHGPTKSLISCSGVRNENGAVTLVVTISLLIAVTLAVIFAARVNLQELRISGNDYRTKQAFNNAEMGLEQGWAYLTRNDSEITRTSAGGWAEADGAQQKWFLCNSNADRTATCNQFLSAAANLSQWLVYPDAITSANPSFTVHFLTSVGSGVVPETLPTIHLYALGKSDDLSAESKVQITLTSASPFAGDPPDVPVVAGGNIALSGSLDITPRSYEAETGDAMAGMQTKALAGGNTLVSGSAECVIPDECTPDVEELEGNVWSSLFNLSQEDMKNEIANGNINGEILSGCSSINETSSGIKWIEGDCDVNSNGIIGQDLSGINSCDELIEDPLWLIIEGDIADKSKFNGTVNIWATLVFLAGAGELELTGNPVFKGSIFGEDNIDFGAGNFTSEPNPYLLKCPGEGESFFLIKEEGSWFDAWTEI